MEDLNSTNGTYVNGEVVKKKLLQNDDTLEIGKYKIVFIDKAVQANPSPLTGSPVMSSTIVQGLPSTSPAQGLAVGPAIIRILSGPATGRDLVLTKVVTTVGKPGVSVASITRRLTGYVLSQVEGPGNVVVNGQALNKGPNLLNHGDLIELADTRMKFELS
jgi:pSer/pThr/pTyr-binding forkhead associated (FHA) protein